MKTFMKTSVVVTLALAMATFGTSNAQARVGGWPIAAGVFGGLAVGTAIGATVVRAATPVYVYPTYVAPVPVVQPIVQTVAPPPTVYVQQPAPVYCYPSTAVYAVPYPYAYPYVRFGWGYSRHVAYRRR
jgi:hypothetical protein